MCSDRSEENEIHSVYPKLARTKCIQVAKKGLAHETTEQKNR